MRPQRPRWISLLARFILPRIWFVHAPVVLFVQAGPSECVEKLATSTRPSTQRLHQRNLFASGRRYHLQPRQGGFRLTTTSKVRWRYRGRTASTAVMRGTFSPFGDDITRVYLQARINVGYILSAFLVPTFMASIIVFMPWPPVIIAGLLVMLYGLSWIGHRFNAALEAHEMVWFVQTVLGELIPAEVMSLGSESDDVIRGHEDFEAVWRSFYEAHRSAQSEQTSTHEES